MVRRCTGLAVALLLILAFGLAMAHGHAQKLSDTSIEFSAPCEPASCGVKAADESKAVSKIDSTGHADDSEAPAGAIRRVRFGVVTRAIPSPVSQTFPPLLRRPPPVNS